MAVLRRIGVLSLARIQGILMAILGLFIGIIYGAVFATVGLVKEGGPGLAGPVIGLVFLIAAPILYGLMGFIGGALTAFLYNLLAKWIGGIEVEIK